jgi:Tol biopolymer transport system component
MVLQHGQRKLRYQHAAELRADLQRLRRDFESSHTGAAYSSSMEAAKNPGSDPQDMLPSGVRSSIVHKVRRHGPGLLSGAALVVVLLGYGLGHGWFKERQTSPVKTLRERQLTHNPAENRVIHAAISPNGTYIAYVDPKGLHLRNVETGEVHDLQLSEDLRAHLWGVNWFPDGEKLILSTDSDGGRSMIWVISVYGGSPRMLRSDSQDWYPTVSPDGTSIAFVGGRRHEIWIMGSDGENSRKILADQDAEFASPAWSPTGRRLAYLVSRGESFTPTIETVSLEGGAPSVVTSDPYDEPSLLWTRFGRMIFVKSDGISTNAGDNLWEIMADPQTGEPSGTATKLTDWDQVTAFSATVSQDGSRLSVVKAHIRDDVYVGELKGAGTRLDSLTRLTVSDSMDYSSGWVDDSKAILFWSNRAGRNQIFRQRLGQDTPEPLMLAAQDETDAELSPDSRWILYWSLAHGGVQPATARLMQLPLSGGSPEQVLEVRKDVSTSFHCPSLLAGFCVISHWTQGQLIFQALKPDPDRGREVARTKIGSPSNLDWSISSDGQHIAVASQDQLSGKVRILDLRDGTERDISLPDSWKIWNLRWAADGSALFVAARSTGYILARIGLDGTTHTLLDRGRVQWLTYPCPSPDGRYLAFSQRTAESNAWMLENF